MSSLTVSRPSRARGLKLAQSARSQAHNYSRPSRARGLKLATVSGVPTAAIRVHHGRVD